MKSLVIKFFGTKKHKKQFYFANIQSILLKPIGDAVGDAIVHTSHLRQIKEANPHIKLGVLVTERNKLIYQHAGFIDAILDESVSTYIQEHAKWDLYLDFMPSFTSKSIFCDWLLAPKFSINFGKKEKKHYNLNTVKNYDFSTHIPKYTHIKNYLNCSIIKDNIKSDAEYIVPFNSEQVEKVEKFWNKNKSLRILLNPQGSKNEIPPAELKQLMDNIPQHYVEKIEFLLTNTHGAQEYINRLGINLKLSPKTTILEYFAFVNSADIVIAVDGGGVHVACACAKPLLAFYANNPKLTNMWAPITKKGGDSLLLVGKNLANNASETYNFDIQAASEWLNNQIKKHL
ncbi:glycosyltransferase family 9 protein [Actinobacillus vicugnae]|uniref:glycosyltransferase family 9 protein n=1 Tax=Actinobacillus vicugnae TaxID=2573093 RepID=UPI0012422177|nr:glycosyltransferase family 9 protein [Actinobacillus vicugnae]